MVRRILLATDLSEPAAQAAAVARDFVCGTGAHLHILRVAAAADHAAAADLHAYADGLGITQPVVVVVRAGHPATEIVRYAFEHDIDLIVVGEHGHTGVTRALLGSVAERVARTAACPVLMVPADRRGAAPGMAPSDAGLQRCIVCESPSEDLVCEPCRARIRMMSAASLPTSHPGQPVGELTREETERILAGELVGRLGCHHEGRTYVVPVTYLFADGAIYLRSTEGLKIEMMRANPSVCFQVDHIRDLANWQSAIVWGTFRELHGEEASGALSKLHDRLAIWSAEERGWPPASSADRSELEGHRAVGLGRHAVVARIDITEMTGRFQQR